MSPPSNFISKNLKFPVRFHGQVLVSSKEIIAGKETWNIPEEVPIAFVFNKTKLRYHDGYPSRLGRFCDRVFLN